MKFRFLTAAALLASTTSAYAVGLDRSGQSISVLFQDGNHLEFSLGYTDPTITGTTFVAPGFVQNESGNVGDSFLTFGAGIKVDLNDRWSFALIGDEPYGADTFYGNSSATSALGGTGATVDSYAITALARYKFNDNWSVHGGLRYQEVSASVTLGGVAFGAVNGYDGFFGSDGDVGYVIGAAYEIPAIALRVALTYNSSTTHDLPTTESGLPVPFLNGNSITEVETPESVNLDFQTGIAANTLLFGNVRWANYGQTNVSPVGFTTVTGSSLTDLETGYDFSLGVGRRFNEKWSGSLAVGYSTLGDDDFVSPLAPTNGQVSISVGAKYDVNDSFAIAGGIRYTDLGNAIPNTASTARGSFDGNDAISAGLRFEYKF
ncbi:outer membrane protein transport protein [uncultured Tateyamaria sp.]|uniref:OmpP1/FadL family transporter n=1 Tax=uncultured Tateyamaria sp. TaxID=455651 RepID=UPI0026338228|nr:outer membrane protein transport protein [uncultured Tateyamaria sp.]